MAKFGGPLFFAVYEVERLYGGPEEGGWWYDAGRVVAVYNVTRSERAHKSGRVDRYGRTWSATVDRVTPQAMRRFERLAAREHGYLPVKPRGYRNRGSVIGGPDIEVYVMARLPHDYPEQRPHYE